MTDVRAETEKAFAEYKRLAECGDWARWAELFTEDAVYEEHWLGTFRGRAAIRSWIVDLMAQGRVTCGWNGRCSTSTGSASTPGTSSPTTLRKVTDALEDGGAR